MATWPIPSRDLIPTTQVKPGRSNSEILQAMRPLLLDALLVVLIAMHSYSKIAAFYGVPEVNIAIAQMSQNSALNNNAETSSAGAARLTAFYGIDSSTKNTAPISQCEKKVDSLLDDVRFGKLHEKYSRPQIKKINQERTYTQQSRFFRTKKALL